ncbi:response regulator transcription factor [Brucella sp. BE17]|uniref:response regulator transcription factor n=1 Tax=Brucella sp. BE17 TaxID=3142977 RepID=UPI0031B9D0AB
MSTAPEKIALIIHPDEFFRIALRLILNQKHGIREVVQKARTAQFRPIFRTYGERIAVVIVDEKYVSPENVALFCDEFPNLNFVVVTDGETETAPEAFMAAHAKAYISRKAGAITMSHGIGQAIAGKTFKRHLPLTLTAEVSDNEADASENNDEAIEYRLEKYGLSARQMEVWKCLSRGLTSKLIAREIHIAEGTVKIHLKALYKNLGVKNGRAAAALGAKIFG